MTSTRTAPAPAAAPKDPAELDRLCINTIRTLSIDAVQAAKSGHPGTPMALAPTAYCLWQRFLRYDPEDPRWPNRDRFVLSNGHASMLLYSLLHLTGVKAVNESYEEVGRAAVTLDDIKNFRQAGSRCPGHPEYGWTSGVEATTGPLGQGVANERRHGRGRPLARRHLQPARLRSVRLQRLRLLRRRRHDGGSRLEAASLAGHLKLSNLCWIYDNNRITIEGPTDAHLQRGCRHPVPGVRLERDPGGRRQRPRHAEPGATRPFWPPNDRPTLIIVDSHIGYGAPHRQDTREAHGEPLGADEVRLAKEFYGWDPDAQFLVPDGVREHFQRTLGRAGQRAARGLEQAGCGVSEEVSRRWPPGRLHARPHDCHRAGTRTCRSFLPIPKAWPAATPRPRR